MQFFFTCILGKWDMILRMIGSTCKVGTVRQICSKDLHRLSPKTPMNGMSWIRSCLPLMLHKVTATFHLDVSSSVFWFLNMYIYIKVDKGKGLKCWTTYLPMSTFLMCSIDSQYFLFTMSCNFMM